MGKGRVFAPIGSWGPVWGLNWGMLGCLGARLAPTIGL